MIIFYWKLERLKLLLELMINKDMQQIYMAMKIKQKSKLSLSLPNGKMISTIILLKIIIDHKLNIIILIIDKC